MPPLPPTNRERTRPLYLVEIKEAQRVFGDQIDYDRVWMHENVRWTNILDRLMRWLRRLPPPGPMDNNAVVLGNHFYFPVAFPSRVVPPDEPDAWFMPWLIHEMTHVWQYQHAGWIYLVRGLAAQFRYGAAAYDFGGLDNLLKRRQEKCTFSDFNPEQQGEIARSYYHYVRSANNVDEPNMQNTLSAYEPYIQDIRQGG